MPRIGLDLPTLIQAAAELADAQGLEAVTLASVAQKLRIRSPSLYNHVNGLPDLRRHLALKGLDLLTAELNGAAQGQTGDAAVYALADAYLAFARKHPGLYEAIQRAPDGGDELLAAKSGELVGRIVGALSAYGLKGDAALHAVRVFRSMLHGFVSLERQGGFGLPLGLDATFQMMIEIFLTGIRKL